MHMYKHTHAHTQVVRTSKATRKQGKQPQNMLEEDDVRLSGNKGKIEGEAGPFQADGVVGVLSGDLDDLELEESDTPVDLDAMEADLSRIISDYEDHHIEGLMSAAVVSWEPDSTALLAAASFEFDSAPL